LEKAGERARRRRIGVGYEEGRARGRGGGRIQGRAVREGVAEDEIYSNSGAGGRAAAEGRELFV